MKRLSLTFILLTSLCLPALAQETDAQKGKRLRAEHCADQTRARIANLSSDDGRDAVKATKLYKPGWKAKKVKRAKR